MLYVDEMRAPLINIAAAYANYKIVSMLISGGDSLVSVVNRNSGSPLHYGVTFGSLNGTLEILLARAWGLYNGSDMHPGVRYTAVTLTGELLGERGGKLVILAFGRVRGGAA